MKCEWLKEQILDMIFCVLILVFLLSYLSPISTNDDKECQESYTCSPSENCLFYQEQITKIKSVTKIETKNEILTNLR